MCILVEKDIADADSGRFARPAGAPKQCLDAQTELLETERLGQVVVAALPEADPQIVDVITSGEEYDRGLHPITSDAAAHLETIQLGHVHVQDDEIGRFRLDGAQGIETIALGANLVSGKAKGAGDEIGQGVLVVNHHDCRFVLWRGHEAKVGQLPGSLLRGRWAPPENRASQPTLRKGTGPVQRGARNCVQPTN